MFKKITTLFALAIIATMTMNAQNAPEVKLGAFVETYIATDNSKEIIENGQTFRPFAHISGRENEFGLNVAQLTGTISWNNAIRGKVTIHAGDIMAQTYNFQAIQEANIGVCVSENMWIDAGYFLTHIGSESLMPKDNWFSSHSLITAHAEPYFQSGVKGSYSGEQLSFALMILNGFGIFNENNDNKTFGWSVGFNPSKDISLGYNAIIGNESPLNSKANTLFLNNINFEFHPMSNLDLKGQIDILMQDIPDVSKPGETKSGTFIGFAAQGRYHLTEKIRAMLRLAYGTNDDGIVGGVSKNFLDASLGGEYKPSPFSYVRLEGRMISFDEETGKTFIDSDGKATNSRMELILTFGVWVD